MIKKIVDYQKIKKKFFHLKKNKQKIVLCHGVFDLFHIGHLRHFKFAKSKGDHLLVSLTADKFVTKGYAKPIFNQVLRSELISSIEEVDSVVISESASALDIIRQVKPNFYCKGIEYKDHSNDITKKIKLEENEVKKNKGKVIYSSDITYSSSKLINQNFQIYSKKQLETIKQIKKKYSLNHIEDSFKKISKIRTLVIGEIIFDDYTFSEAIGKSAKEPILILKEKKSERYLGGAGAIVKNISNLTKRPSLISYVGEKDNKITEINKHLGKNVKKFFVKKFNSPTIIKKRYIDQFNNTKLFGIYNFNDLSISKKNELDILNFYNKEVKKNDLVMVTDYGHGLITKKIANQINRNKKFTSLNVQLNAANMSYHSIDKYKNANLLVVNERELRHDVRDRDSNINKIMLKVSRDKNFQLILVTRGADGLLLYDKKTKKFYECAAFASNVVDKIGSGDIINVFFSLCVRAKIDYELALFISSIAAAEKLKSFANKKFVNIDLLMKIISHYLK
jgi:rfaE bifunctional protein kinase chain/domain